MLNLPLYLYAVEIRGVEKVRSKQTGREYLNVRFEPIDNPSGEVVKFADLDPARIGNYKKGSQGHFIINAEMGRYTHLTISEFKPHSKKEENN